MPEVLLAEIAQQNGWWESRRRPQSGKVIGFVIYMTPTGSSEIQWVDDARIGFKYILVKGSEVAQILPKLRNGLVNYSPGQILANARDRLLSGSERRDALLRLALNGSQDEFDQETFDLLGEAARDPDPRLRGAAVLGADLLGWPQFAELVRPLAGAGELERPIRLHAAELMETFGPAQGSPGKPSGSASAVPGSPGKLSGSASAVPDMTAEEQQAYDEARRKIALCQSGGGHPSALDLSDCCLTHLPPEIGELTALTELNLSGNQLVTLPSEIGGLSALTQLDLGVNRLNALPPEIGRLSALIRLDLRDNQLTALPPEIGQLSALRGLDLELNRLDSLPPEIGRLRGLTLLYLSRNRLSRVPPEIFQLSALQDLSLSANPLKTLPPEIGQLSRLNRLLLIGCQLEALPAELRQLSVWELGLRENPALGLPDSLLEDQVDGTTKQSFHASTRQILDHYFSLHPEAAGETLRAGGG